MKVVDTKGQLCPAPLIAAKRALKEAAGGDSFMIITDNIISFNNLSRFLKDNKAAFSVRQSGGVWELSVTKNADVAGLNPEDYCTPVAHFEKGDYIVVFSSETMGDGDSELGKLLISNFIKAIMDIEKLPKKLIFYNSGVKLASNDSHVIDQIRDLEKMGVEIMLCSTCVSFYKLENTVGAGILGNMFTIATAMAESAKVLKP